MKDERLIRRLRFIVHRSSFIVLFVSCATAPTPPPALPDWTEVPHGVLDAFCSRLHDEGISADTPVNVIRTTQPLISAQSITGLAEVAFYQKRFDPFFLAQEANRTARKLPVVVPNAPCAWRAVDESAARSHDTMTVELSSPFVNPFARHLVGVLGRVSLAREAATWYFVPVVLRDGRWVVGQPMPLGMR